ncbi:MFS transporter [Nonomuraea sp. K274]|uniref:MFS transporter n=1 Tax=Nonomuraea cypriaca TaxID=1187855 RepID=A0A931AE75_9ACTN|nr:MFS transporter [Nonomuraea cypriaca]MBF8190273.1 MFS transporter [Nonomuraea cypriaca]
MPAQDLRRGRPGVYRRTLSGRDFRLLWLGSSLSLVGDGMTFVALTWIVLSQPGGTQRLGLLTVCYTLPVFAGGLLAGPVLDRFDKRHVLAADSVVRGAAVASIPLTAALGEVPAALPFAVAAIYGLFKMVPLAGFPAAIPDLVAPDRRDAANALESLSFSVSGMVGPALGGLLIGVIGGEAVLALDALTYVVFAVAALAVRRPLRTRPSAHRPAGGSAAALRPAGESAPAHRPVGGSALAHPPAADRPAGVLGLFRDPVLLWTTLAFAAFNIAMGMLLVVGPWLAKTQLPGGPQALGVLLSVMAAGELAGAAVAGARQPRARPVVAIATVQLVAAAGFLGAMFAPHVLPVTAGYVVIGLFSAPMTVWAQSLRMARIPAPLRGRGFAILRTLMQATPPIGAACVTPLLGAGPLVPAALAMALTAALPAAALLAYALRRPTASNDPPSLRRPATSNEPAAPAPDALTE